MTNLISRIRKIENRILLKQDINKLFSVLIEEKKKYEL